MITVPLWFMIALIGLFFASKNTEKPFDPAGILYYASNKSDFDLHVNSILFGALNTPLNNVVVHITRSSDCLCQLTATRHIKSVKDTVKYIGKRNVTIYIENIKGLSNILTSTPAVAVFDAQGDLSYLDPYSTGIGCLSGNGSVEPYLDTKSTLGAIVPLESTGCYYKV
ncbi:MAG: hypothetical protein ACJAVV_000194 [Alphaproteobacteria bacterium]|jgi:hypothetical protein